MLGETRLADPKAANTVTITRCHAVTLPPSHPPTLPPSHPLTLLPLRHVPQVTTHIALAANETPPQPPEGEHDGRDANAPASSARLRLDSLLEQNGVDKKDVVQKTRAEKDLDKQIAQQLDKAAGSMPSGEDETYLLFPNPLVEKFESKMCKAIKLYVHALSERVFCLAPSCMPCPRWARMLGTLLSGATPHIRHRGPARGGAGRGGACA